MPFNALKRRPLGGIRELKRFLYEAFILPCKDVPRAYLYFTSVIFAFSYSFLDLFIIIDLVKLEMSEMMSFQLTKYALISSLVIAIFLMITRYGGKVIYPFITAILSSAMVLTLAWPYELTPAMIGLIFALVNAPFWALYHVFFAISVSDENVGNEVSLAGTGLTLGVAIGTISGGIFQALDIGFYGLVFGFGGMATGTFMLILYANKKTLRDLIISSGALNETLPEAFRRCRYRSYGTILDGALQTGSTLWAIFLSFSGIGAVAVGLWSGLMVFIKIVFTPIAGAMINHGHRREMMAGAIVTMTGWLPFLVTTTFALPAMYVWSVGNQLFQTGLNSAWYRSRTVASLMAREIILMTSRLIFVPLIIWLLYTDTTYFILFMIGLSCLMIGYSTYWMKSIKIKGPVMPIETLVIKR